MIPRTAELRDFLASSQEFRVADLYTFTLRDGTVLRYTSGDIPLTWGGNTWQVGLRIERSQIKLVIGLEVDGVDLTIYQDDSDQIAGNAFVVVATNGGLDGCRVQIDRAFLSSWVPPVIVGVVGKRFVGRVASLKA